MNIYILCSAILILVYFALGFNVSRLRGALRIGTGSGEHHSGILNRSVRAHGNAAEFIPLFVVMFLYLNSVAATGWLIWVVIAATLSRILHPVGMLLSADLNKPQVFRFLGALGTYACGFVLGIALLSRAFASSPG